MSGIVFDLDSARRIATATRGYEQSLSAPEPTTYQTDGSYGRMMLVQTDVLPAGYTGDLAALGSVVEKSPDGKIHSICPAWIKDVNGKALSANTTYQARYSGALKQDAVVNGTTIQKELGLYLVQVTGGGFGLVYLYPWRYDLISAKLKNGTYTYALCVIWAEDNPDTTECEVFTESSYFDFRTNRSADYLTQSGTGNGDLYLQHLFKVFEFNGARSFTIKDIELAPFHIWAASSQQMILNKSDFYPRTDFSSDTVDGGNHIGSPYMFTRRVKKNADGTPQSVPVSMYGNNASYLMRPFLKTDLWPADQNFNKVNTYTPNSQIIKFLKMDTSYKQQGLNGIIGPNATGAAVTIKSYCEDPLGIGYPAAGVSYILNSINGKLTATAVGRLPNSPMYVAPTNPPTGGAT
jgi:hypothetical protein